MGNEGRKSDGREAKFTMTKVRQIKNKEHADLFAARGTEKEKRGRRKQMRKLTKTERLSRMR